MNVLSTQGWSDYELLDTGDGMRLERFGQYVLSRPDPQILWKKSLGRQWQKADAVFEQQWNIHGSTPQKWLISYQHLKLWVKLTSFKHTGVFPEQVLHWEWMREKVRNAKRLVNVLNLFGYTGISSLVLATLGAKVTHVEASKPTISWARENQTASGLTEKPIRWILDDAGKFVQREIRRNVEYDAILMDPPIYGHGPNGETWDFMKDFPKLLSKCVQLLSPTPLFIIVNAYAISASALMLENVLKDFIRSKEGSIESGELALEEKSSKRLLSTGIFVRWSV